MKKIIKDLESYVSRKRIGREYALEHFLDFLLEFFDAKHILENYPEHIKRTAAENPDLMDAAIEWMNVTDQGIKENGWFDGLGTLYEMMYQSKNKASALGQFFTPAAICDCMTKIARRKVEKTDRINDSACGSGRTLLSAYAELKEGYYIGEDIDHMSVKMCTLNLMIHGARGQVVCHNALSSPINYYDWGYEINEVREPYPVPFYSVRRISNPEPKD